MATTITGVKKAYVDKLFEEATVKTQIDFDGTNFKIDGRVLNYKELHDVHIIKPDFAFVVYGDRAYLLSYVQDETNAMRELRFQSTIAVTNTEGLSYVKTSGIYVTSSDGVNIASVRIVDINSENESYKTDVINESNKNSTVWYPSNKAVTEQISSLKEDLNEKLDKATADGLYAPIGSTGGQGGTTITGYIKPSTGIPKSDLNSSVQASLNKADTALQSVPDAYATKEWVQAQGYGQGGASDSNIITVRKDGSGMYTDVNVAVAYANSLASSTRRIIIDVGVGKWQVTPFTINPYVTLKGHGRENTRIWASVPGTRKYTVEMSINTIIEDIRIDALLYNGEDPSGYVTPMYAVHLDPAGDGECAIRRCYMYSEQWYALGAGVSGDKMYYIEDNIFETAHTSKSQQSSIMIHGNTNCTRAGIYAIVKNNVFKSYGNLYGNFGRLADETYLLANNTFIYNGSYNDVASGGTDAIHPASHGNNIGKLNGVAGGTSTETPPEVIEPDPEGTVEVSFTSTKAVISGLASTNISTQATKTVIGG